MKLPKVENSTKYIGLYIVDFGDHCSVGFTADEVAELLESEKFKNIKIYKIQNAQPNGEMDVKGVSKSRFELESGMFFHLSEKEEAEKAYKTLSNGSVVNMPPARAKLQLSESEDGYIVALMYPAEYEDEFSSWLIDMNFFTNGPASGGTNEVTRYYEMPLSVLEKHQLFPARAFESRTGEELFISTKLAVQR